MLQARARLLGVAVGFVSILIYFPPGLYVADACGGGNPIFAFAGLAGLSGLSGDVTPYYLGIFNEALDKTFGKGNTHAEEWKSASNSKPIDCPRALDCDASKPCRWRNDERGLEQGLYLLAKGTIREMKLQTVFGSDPAPKSPYIMTGAKLKEKGRYFVSDTIPKAGPKAKIQFKYWNTPGVRLKVCIRYPKTKKAVKCSSSFVRSMDDILPPQRIVQVGPIDRPFELIFWDGAYTNKPGGLGILDDIKYSDPDLCSQDKSAIAGKADAAISLSPDNNEDAPFPKATEDNDAGPDTKAAHHGEPRRQEHKVLQKRDVLLDDGLFDGLENADVRHAESALQALAIPLNLRRLTTDESHVTKPEDLDCTFASACHWHSDIEETSLVRFLNASGKVDNNYSSVFSTECTMPKDPFAIFASSSPSDEATLSSQPMRFQRNGVVRFSVCLTQGAVLRVCTKCNDDFYFCSLSQSSQGQTSRRSLPLLFPPDGLCQVVFNIRNSAVQASAANRKATTIAILDDISVSLEEP